VEWAASTGAYLIDDEYGWEFQSGVARTPTLAALDAAGRVITVGTFSNSFTPAVCLSYAVLPPQLMLKWRAARRNSHPQVPWQTQASMASFMENDHWRTHVRKMRTAMMHKRQELLRAIQLHMGEEVELLTGPSSLFILLKTNDGRDEDELVKAAAKENVIVYPTSRYWQGEPPESWRFVQVGFAGIPLQSIEPGIRLLARAWGFSE
jgi:GntR family transcriptional regulator/MocR family aminotransferase